MVSSQVSVWPTNASYTVPGSSVVLCSGGHSSALWRSSEATRNGHLVTPCLKHHSLNVQPVALPADALRSEPGCCDGVQGEQWSPRSPAPAQGRLYRENGNQQHTACGSPGGACSCSALSKHEQTETCESSLGIVTRESIATAQRGHALLLLSKTWQASSSWPKFIGRKWKRPKAVFEQLRCKHSLKSSFWLCGGVFNPCLICLKC